MTGPSPAVEEYFESLPDDRRATIGTLRNVVLENLPAGLEETVRGGMLSYEIPLSRYPKTYNRLPLTYLSLAAQKNHCALYLMCVYSDPEKKKLLERRFAEAAKRLDMGKSCLRFRNLDDLPLEGIGEVIAAGSVEEYIEQYERSRHA